MKMSDKFKYALLGILGSAVLLSILYAATERKNSGQEYRDLFSKTYKVLAPGLPMKTDFAGEQVPLDLFYVRESLDREILTNTFMHASTILMFKRANRWFPVIEPILKRNNIPDDFKYLALAESNLANVVSPAGAEGFWQFIKTTGQKYGLEINEEVDERYNLEKATEAACKYFRDAYDKHSSWTLVAASYNRGIDGVGKALEKQHVKSYYDAYLVDETSRYVYRILALKQIYLHPTAYGFYLREGDFYPQLKTSSITVDSSIKDLPSFAQKMKINYRVLREYNPWLRRYSLSNKTGKSYTIALPAEGWARQGKSLKGEPGGGTFFHDTLRIDHVNW
jgi:membrane-bound lytic murein transglycosylase D